MIDIEKIDSELYKAKYITKKQEQEKEIWNKIKNNQEILREAVKVIRDKFDEQDIVKGVTIAEQMLIFYDSIDKISYNNLINSIYTNQDIARIVIDGSYNGGYSYLLMSLWNHNLKLTQKQKDFAVNEAMNKIGTIRYQNSIESYSKKLDEMGISDNDTITLEGLNPVGKKTAYMCINKLFASINREQAHGKGDFDIRYYILKNPNWTLEEKQQLIMDFWYDQKDYEESLEQWEWHIKNILLDADPIYDPEDSLDVYTYDYLLKIFKDKEKAKEALEQINFCNLMHKLRPTQTELEYQNVRKKEKRLI